MDDAVPGIDRLVAAAKQAEKLPDVVDKVNGYEKAASASLERTKNYENPASQAARDADEARKKVNAALEAVNTEILTRERKLGEISVRLTTLEGALAARESDAERTSKLLGELQKRSAKLDADAGLLAQANQRSEAVSKKLADDVTKLGTAVAASQTRVTELDGTLAELNKKIDEIRKNLPEVKPPTPKTEDDLSPNQLKVIQQRLRELGLYNGGIDGNLGSGTRRAITAYQQRRGEKRPDGRLSATQIEELLAPPTPNRNARP